MSSLVVNALSVAIGLYIILLGVLNLTPIISNEAHKEIRKIFIRQVNKGFPFANQTGYKPNPHSYRRFVGYSYTASGLFLTLMPVLVFLAQCFSGWGVKAARVIRQVANLANVYLLALNGLDMVMKYLSAMSLAKASTPLVFSLLLLCRLIVAYQVRHALALEDSMPRRRQRKLAAEKLPNGESTSEEPAEPSEARPAAHAKSD